MEEHLRIVLVDDADYFLRVLKEYLSHEGFECITFSNPVEALQYVKNDKSIHAVVSDLEMPQMAGFQLAKEIRDARPQMRIIIMSGHDFHYLKKRAVEAGVDGKVELLDKSNIFDLPKLLNS